WWYWSCLASSLVYSLSSSLVLPCRERRAPPSFPTRRSSDLVPLVRQPHMLRIGIRRREHRHRRYPHPPATPDHPASDLPAIGNQYLFEHRLFGHRFHR